MYLCLRVISAISIGRVNGASERGLWLQLICVTARFLCEEPVCDVDTEGGFFCGAGLISEQLFSLSIYLRERLALSASPLSAIVLTLYQI